MAKTNTNMAGTINLDCPCPPIDQIVLYASEIKYRHLKTSSADKIASLFHNYSTNSHTIILYSLAKLYTDVIARAAAIACMLFPGNSAESMH